MRRETVSKRSPTSIALVDPTQLNTLHKKDGLLQVIIETPKNSRNKYSFDVEQRVFALKEGSSGQVWRFRM